MRASATDSHGGGERERERSSHCQPRERIKVVLDEFQR